MFDVRIQWTCWGLGFCYLFDHKYLQIVIGPIYIDNRPPAKKLSEVK